MKGKCERVARVIKMGFFKPTLSHSINGPGTQKLGWRANGREGGYFLSPYNDFYSQSRDKGGGKDMISSVSLHEYSPYSACLQG